MHRRTVLFCVCVLFAPLWNADASEATVSEDVEPTEVATIVGTRVVDADGVVRRLGVDKRVQPVVLVFFETECVISRRYIPILNEFQKFADDRGVDFYAINSEPNLSLEELDNFRQEFDVQFPVIVDASGDLALRLKPNVVPEAFLIDKQDRLVYRGRIDNWFAKVGQPRRRATSHDLRDAVVAVVSGKSPATKETQAVGCVFEAWRPGEFPEQVTYTRHVEPILRTHCSDCHQPESVAPFALQNYDDARRRAEMIAFVTGDKFMPPWWNRQGHGQFWGSRHLSGRQLDLLSRWAESGAPEGDPADLLPTPPTERKSQRRQPDVTFQIPEYELPAAGEDIYRYFVFEAPPELKDDTVMMSVQIEAGDPEVVHHLDYFVDYSGRARKLDAEDPEPGFSVFGTGSFLSYFDGGFLGAWAPGASRPSEARDADGAKMGQFIKGGGDFVIEIHYHLSGKKTSDNTKISLFLEDPENVDRYIGTLFAGTQDVDVPAGDSDYRRKFYMDVTADFDLFAIAGHMHYLGRDITGTAVLPDGTKRPLLQLDRWDFRWQGSYSYLEPVRIPAGSRLDFEYSFDNSSDNVDNPFEPPVRATWGWGTDQEMCEVYLVSSPVKNEDFDRLRRMAYASWFRPADPAFELPLDISDPDSAFRAISDMDIWDPSVTRQLRVLGSDAENFDQVVARFKRHAESHPDDAEAQAAYGLMELTNSWTSISDAEGYQQLLAADAAFDKALKIDSSHWGARFNKAATYASAPRDYGLAPAAIEHFEALIKIQRDSGQTPDKFARTYVLLGDLYESLDQPEKSIETFKHGLAVFPEDEALKRKTSKQSPSPSP